MAALRQSIENDQTPPAAAAAKRAKGKRTAKGNPAQREILGKRSACETVAKARRAEKGGIVLRRPVSIETLSTDPRPHLCRQLVLWGGLARDVQKAGHPGGSNFVDPCRACDRRNSGAGPVSGKEVATPSGTVKLREGWPSGRPDRHTGLPMAFHPPPAWGRGLGIDRKLLSDDIGPTGFRE